MKNPITTDVFDSRDLIKYYEYITEQVIEDYNEFIQNPEEEIEEIIYGKHDILMQVDLYDEYQELYEFITDLERYCSDFEYGETIIHEDYFVDYCEELLKDCGELPKDIPHYIEIDWEQTANNIKQDYEEFCYDGETYFSRSC